MEDSCMTGIFIYDWDHKNKQSTLLKIKNFLRSTEYSNERIGFAFESKTLSGRVARDFKIQIYVAPLNCAPRASRRYEYNILAYTSPKIDMLIMWAHAHEISILSCNRLDYDQDHDHHFSMCGCH